MWRRILEFGFRFCFAFWICFCRKVFSSLKREWACFVDLFSSRMSCGELALDR